MKKNWKMDRNIYIDDTNLAKKTLSFLFLQRIDRIRVVQTNNKIGKKFSIFNQGIGESIKIHGFKIRYFGLFVINKTRIRIINR